MNENKCWKGKLWSDAGRTALEKLPLAFWASRRRQELLELLDRMNPTIEELTAAAALEARRRPEALRLMRHPGVGPLTALAFVLIIGTPERFGCAKQICNYVGLIPCGSLLRFLLVEAAQAAVRCNADWRRRYRHLAMRRQRNIAKVAMGRRLGARLYWMWRNGREYSPSLEFGSHAGELGTGNGGH